MKKYLLLLILPIVFCTGYSQNYDLVVLSNGDSIACHIDSISETHVYFHMKYSDEWIETQMGKTGIADHQSGTIDKDSYTYKQGTSYISGLKKVISPELLPPKHSILLSTDHIFSLTISYERIIALNNNWYASLRLAPGYTAESGNDMALIGQTSMLYGKTKHFFEGGVAYYQNLTFPDGVLIPLAGYRFMGKRGLSLKAYGTIWFDVIDDSEWGTVNPGVHFSIGYRFRL